MEERVLELEQLKINSDEGEGWFTKNINIFVIISLTLSIFLSIIAIVHVTNGGFVGGEKVTEGIRKYVNDKISEASFIKIKSNSNTISNVDLEHIINELKRVELIAVSKNTPMEIVYPKQDSYSQDTKQLEIKSDFFIYLPQMPMAVLMIALLLSIIKKVHQYISLPKLKIAELNFKLMREKPQ